MRKLVARVKRGEEEGDSEADSGEQEGIVNENMYEWVEALEVADILAGMNEKERILVGLRM